MVGVTVTPDHLVLLTWAIAALATLGVVTRPWRWPEAVWAVGGAVLLVALRLLPLHAAIAAVAKGADVYLFLSGMMLLSEIARREGLFDWLALQAVNHAKGSPKRLFLLVYLVGVVVTSLLSNDAAAVVLTPAVFAAARRAKTSAMPLLFICAFIANAASFVLPISNPANIVLYGNHTPALLNWLSRFALPSLCAIVMTFFLLRWSQRHALQGACAADLPVPALSATGRVALLAILVTAVVLLGVSAFDIALGWPTALLGVLTALAVLVRKREAPWPLLRGVSWNVLPLVAGLFVLVEALHHTGVIKHLATALQSATQQAPVATPAVVAALVALATNLMNNLPLGLIASSTVMQAHSPERLIDVLLIGVDLGPNLSVTGSLATILWLNAIRREGEDVGFFAFLKIGAIVMLPALIPTVALRLLFP